MTEYKILSKKAAAELGFPIGSHVQNILTRNLVEGIDLKCTYDSAYESCNCGGCDDNTDTCAGCGHSMTNRVAGNGVCCISTLSDND